MKNILNYVLQTVIGVVLGIGYFYLVFLARPYLFKILSNLVTPYVLYFGVTIFILLFFLLKTKFKVFSVTYFITTADVLILAYLAIKSIGPGF